MALACVGGEGETRLSSPGEQGGAVSLENTAMCCCGSSCPHHHDHYMSIHHGMVVVLVDVVEGQCGGRRAT